ncbi:MAG: non-ribosomal peptide synthetase, partial [Eubacterium sp.]|nr:non-ribosomal peptide synthetase [Eubacterium sp.]
MNYVELFKAAVLNNGNDPALTDRDGKRTLTYRELDELSGRVAAKLAALSVKKQDAVLIILPRCSEYVAAELGIFKLGAVFVPLIPEYPKDRVAYIKKDASAVCIIDETFFDDIDTYPVKEAVPSGDKDRAVIIYTSGSTGNPKGVVYDREAFCAQVIRNRSVVEDIQPLIFAACSTMSFCVTMNEYFTMFSLGGHVHMLSDAVRSDALLMQRYFKEHELTAGFVSPRIVRVYKNEDPKLVRLFTGGERLVNAFPEGYELYNQYGQTETIGAALFFPVDRSYDNTPIGKPSEGVEAVILDADGNEAADGEEGQLCMIGTFPYEYNNLKEQSEKTFEKLSDGRIRIYTGDMGKKLPDGNILYLNRQDWMLKIHGQRVEPGEIEAVMNEAAGVTGAVVKAFDQEDGTMLLCGFYTGTPAGGKEAIRMHLEEKLPGYMIPGTLVHLEAFPLNANGKVDRLSIRKPDMSSLMTEYEAPEGEVEEAVCAGIAKILHYERVGRNDNFFELGGNSLNAVALESECGIEGLTVKQIMIGKTPKGIAECYEKTLSENRPVYKRASGVRKEYPMTQSLIYNFYDAERSGDTIDLMDLRGFWKLDVEVDAERLKKALEDTLDAHPVYSINFTDDTERRIIRNEVKPAEVQFVSLSDADFEAYRRKNARYKRNLQKDKMYDAAIVSVENERYLYLNMTHQVFDG